jgi:chromosome segregation ATPase
MKMGEPGLNNNDAAFDLIELHREVEELEAGRTGLLKRIEQARVGLQSAGDRTARLRAAVAIVREHLASNAAAASNLRALRDEMMAIGQSMGELSAETLGLLFEADGLKDSLVEAEDEMERLLEILVEGKPRYSRGH